MAFTTGDELILNGICPGAKAAGLGTKIKSVGTSPVFIRIDGNGFAITNGIKTPYAVIPRDCTITGWKLSAFDAAGALVADTLTCDVLVSTSYAVAPTTATGSGTKPALSAHGHAASTDLTGWTKALTAGSLVGATISNSPATAITLILILDVE